MHKRKHSVTAVIVGKVVSLPIPTLRQEDGSIDHIRTAKFTDLLYEQVSKHTTYSSAVIRTLTCYFRFNSTEPDQVLTDFVNKCRRTAMRKIHGNRNRKEREEVNRAKQD